MPFPMTHLLISHEIMLKTRKIENHSDFILGSLAPDSVHFRDNYSSDYKLVSHLCVGKEKWGSVTNNDEWEDNILLFIERNNKFISKDFIYGYCSHILADIQNNRKIYLPFREEVNEELKHGEKSKYHHESSAIDNELSLDNKISEIFKLLENSKTYEIEGLIYENELNKMKNRILFNQYTNVISKDLSKNKHVTIKRIRLFIEEESLYIKELLFK